MSSLLGDRINDITPEGMKYVFTLFPPGIEKDCPDLAILRMLMCVDLLAGSPPIETSHRYLCYIDAVCIPEEEYHKLLLRNEPWNSNPDVPECTEKKNTRIKRFSRKCAKCDMHSPRIMKCSVCRNIYYCSEECQKSHWSTHKKECVKPVKT